MTTIALQPELRALMVFDTLPAGCIVFLCTDAYSVPHIRPGEFVVVDTKDRKPRDGEVYVIQWQSGRRNICQAHRRPSRFVNAKPGDMCWHVAGLCNPRGKAAIDKALAESMQRGKVYPGWTEGPFADDDGHLEGKLVGCVIGLYAPIAEGPMRLIGGAS